MALGFSFQKPFALLKGFENLVISSFLFFNEEIECNCLVGRLSDCNFFSLVLLFGALEFPAQ